MELRQVRLTDPQSRPLLEGLTVEYETRYGANTEMGRTHPEEFDPPEGLFLVVMDGEVTAAGGGYRRFAEGVCEVKRMWTDASYRRRGLALRVLMALEDAAKASGYHRLILETGPRQPEAVAMYERRGYQRIDYYGPYEEALAFAVDLA